MRHPGNQAFAQQVSQSSSIASGRPKRRWALLAAAVLGVSMAGCELQRFESNSAQADADVERIVKEVQLKLGDDSPKTREEMLKSLGLAAANADASNSDRALAKGMLADAEVADANNKMLSVGRQELEITRLAWEISQTGAQVQRMANGVKQLHNANDPSIEPAKKVVDALDDEHKEFDAKSTLAKQDVAGLTADIQKRQAEIASLEEQRNAAAELGESLAEKSRSNTSEAVATFDKAVKARTQAGILAAKVGAAKALLIPVQHELAMAQARQAAWEGTLKELDQNKAAVQQEWADLQGQQLTPQAKAATDLAQSLSDAATGEAGKSKVQALDDLIKSAQADRDAAAKRLADAAKHYSEAADASAKVYIEMGTKLNEEHSKDSPSRLAWTQMREIYNQVGYRALQSATQSLLGDLYTVQAQELRNRQRLATMIEPAMAAAQAPVPAPLAGSVLQQELDQAQKSGKEAYDAADKIVTEQIYHAPTANTALKHAGQFTQAMSHYGLYQLTQDQSHLSQAREEAEKTDNGAAIELPPGPLSPAQFQAPAPETPAPEKPAPAAPATPAADTTAVPASAPADAPAAEPAK